MEIKSFRIRNYRSIVDSGTCYVSGDNITILAGKNESGKTAILEALEDFTVEKNIREEAKPIYNIEALPEINVVFKIDKKILNDIFNEIGYNHSVTTNIEIEIKKVFPDKYSINEASIALLGLQNDAVLKNLQMLVEKTHEEVKSIREEFPALGGTLPDIDFENITNLSTRLQQFKNQIQPNLTAITNVEKKNNFVKYLNELIKQTVSMKDENAVIERFLGELKEYYLPNFILFSSFDDIFPTETPFVEVSNNELIKDLDLISNLNLDLIKSGSISEKMSHKQRLNVRLKKDYRKFWTQDVTNLHIDWDSEKLFFFVKDGNYFYPPNMRSKGKQWHLAFYVRISARAKEDVPNVILIDEPGLFLHARAQIDVLKKLEDSAKYSPVVYSTHSPYLIDINNLNRIRLVFCRSKEKGTLISNKIHKEADKETLTPIITAIGLDLSIGLDIAKNNNIILEGITDYYYLRAFLKLLNFEFKEEIHFIPGVGADKANVIVSLMIGWSLNHCVLLDNDEKGRSVKRKLEKAFLKEDVKILSVSEVEDEEIEDLFERNDFIKYVLNENPDNIPSELKNSGIVKQTSNTYDKVLLSKKFFENIESIELSNETKDKFSQLFAKIDSALFTVS